MSDKDIKILKYETVRDRLNTRENSTLVVATVASSAALILMTLNSQFHCYALLFALLGISYRELTIFFSDYRDHELLKALEKELTVTEFQKKLNTVYPTLPKKNKLVRIIRSLIIRVLLFLPVVVFFLSFFILFLKLLRLLKPFLIAVGFLSIILDFGILLYFCIIAPLYYEEKMISDC